ncbi:MAG: bifunctional (p)ppGpp synthetase/guanosine-3',5'-bis(diphosphate) 3'-pyrophosphohydrolase [Acutalibacteraceae bacterium]
MKAFYNDYEQLKEDMSACNKNFDLELIDKAYNLALDAHGNQRRISGIPYILHPTSVACILVELGMDTQSIVAALLHDVVEDTAYTVSDIEKMFGKEIANLVDGVTKLGKIPYSSQEEQQAENLRKMLIAMAEDIRVIIIKLADRLHNMRTIECMEPQKRRDKARENMEVYAPIAHRLGIRTIKEELEDLSLKYLDPVAYKEIEDELELGKEDREHLLAIIKRRIEQKLSPVIPDLHLEGRVKSINGIYRKVFIKNRLMEEIYDIYAVRVIVNTVNDCYNILGIIHEAFRPIPNRFKDYISTPKPNMYQSLHTTVIGKEGIPFEVQIRTWEMHRLAEYGIAAHWKYKLGLKSKKDSLDESLAWIRNMLENQNENSDAGDIIRMIKSDLVPEEVFILTPRGDVINLPMGATVIDFAYAIHTEVGNHMIGAKVDKRIVPIDYKVKTGQIVEILTTKERSRGPSRDWLKIVKTSEARSKIRQWFKRERREENLAQGKIEIEREFDRLGIRLNEAQMKDFLMSIAKTHRCETIDKFYETIGYGGILLSRIMPRIKDEYNKLKQKNEPLAENFMAKKEAHVEKKPGVKGVIIDGIENCLVKFSKCCNPIPGDKIIGFITRGYGVSLHKRNCKNVPSDIKKSPEPNRWVHAYWANSAKEEFNCDIKIITLDKASIIAEITMQFSYMHVEIQSFNLNKSKDGKSQIYMSILVKNMEHLKSVMSKISKINGVISVDRA